MDRVTQRLWRAVEEPVPSVAEGTPRVLLNLPMLLSRVFFFKLPQNRHPERSASQMDRVTQRLWRAVEEPVPSAAEGTPRVLLNLPMLLSSRINS